MEKSTQQTRLLITWFIAAYLLILLLKIYLATVLDLYSDEIFYWFASTRLALAYSDLPFMTALMAGAGSSLSAGSTLAVRSIFLLMGSSLPFLIYWLALPFGNQRQALMSAILTLCLPLAGFLGLLAVPDVPLIFYGLLSIGFFHRALLHNDLKYWFATGVFVALGLCTHYRFFLYPLAAVCFLIFHNEAKVQWRNPRLWLAMAIASLGLIPILWFNLSNQLSSASFYLVERHPWEFQANGLLHIFKQAGLVTPPLYGLFIACLWQLYQEARSGSTNAALLLSFSLCNLSVYMILAPWTDADSTSIHWPLSGYFPLLVAAPHVLERFFQWAEQRWQKRRALQFSVSIPAIGFAGTLLAFLGVGSQGFQSQLQALVGPDVLSNKMAGWREFASYTDPLISQQYDSLSPVVITDNYYTAAQVQFAGLSNRVYTLDRDKAVRDGRITQLQLWEIDEKGLSVESGESALYINEDSTLLLEEKIELMTTMCARSSNISPIDELSLFAGDKRFSFYKVDTLSLPDKQTAFPCPYPVQAWLDSPIAGSQLSGEILVAGWSFSEDIGIADVRILLDGEEIAVANYGIERLDVAEVKNVRTDPNSPKLGFEFSMDTTLFDDGEYQLSLLIENHQGSELHYGSRPIVISNRTNSD